MGRQLTGVELARWYRILHLLNVDEVRRNVAHSRLEDAAQPGTTQTEDATFTTSES